MFSSTVYDHIAYVTSSVASSMIFFSSENWICRLPVDSFVRKISTLFFLNLLLSCFVEKIIGDHGFILHTISMHALDSDTFDCFLLLPSCPEKICACNAYRRKVGQMRCGLELEKLCIESRIFIRGFITLIALSRFPFHTIPILIATCASMTRAIANICTYFIFTHNNHLSATSNRHSLLCALQRLNGATEREGERERKALTHFH